MLGPNIIGELGITKDIGFLHVSTGLHTGAFYKGAAKTQGVQAVPGWNAATIGFNAHNSNAVFSNSATVQTNSTTALILIKFWLELMM